MARTRTPREPSSPRFGPSLSAASIAALPPSARRRFLAGLSPAALKALARILRHDWAASARPDQRPPEDAWRAWVFLGGRGAGKTRAGAEWLRARLERAHGDEARAAVVGATFADVREVMIEGPSGLRAIAPPDRRPVYEASRRRLVWPHGAVAYAFSAEEPDRLRGPQFAHAWADEFCAWPDAAHALAMIEMGHRLGRRPQLAVTTTPRPQAALKQLLARPDVVATHAPTRANAANLAPSFLAAVEAAYAGTALGRQELDGMIVDDRPGALWSRTLLDQAADAAPPALDALERVVVGLDPPAEAGAGVDACGIVVAGAVGAGMARRAWVLADRTVQGLSPAAWAARAAETARAFEADRVIAEVNQGGALVSAVLATADPTLAVRAVRASRGKRARAEPIAALYEQGRVRHARRFPALEDEMCAFGAPEFRASPDRVDALVWALWALLIDGADGPRLRPV